MFILSGTLALRNGHILTGAAIKDGGPAAIATAGRGVRYFGDTIDAANAGLADMVLAQDLVSRLYHDSVAFQALATTLGAHLDGAPAVVVPAGDVLDVSYQLGCHLVDGSYLYIAGSSKDEGAAIRSNDLTAAYALLDADVDFGSTTGIFAGVLT